MVRNYVNLTNGLYTTAQAPNVITDPVFLRIRSTDCEQKNWERVLDSASDDLLLHAALGVECRIWDGSCKNREPRALWQGVQFIVFSARVIWGEMCPGDAAQRLEGRAKTSGRYFADTLCDLQNTFAYRRFKFYGKHFRERGCPIQIARGWLPDAADGNYAKAREIALKATQPST